ncbi:MAG: hypothetical protein QM691_12200 [Opitutaceae bacterium]
MSEWWSVLAIFWIAYLVDGLRRRRLPHTTIRRGAPWPAALRHERLHLLPPAPWTWRFRADDPPFALSPEGLCNQYVATAGRPAARAPFTAVWRWEQLESVVEKQGWLVINGRLFAPAAAAWPAAELLALARVLAPLAPAEREAHLRRWLDLRLRPAHWRRRLAVIRRRTGDCAWLNTAALLAMAAVTAIVCLAPSTEEYEEAPRILRLLSPLLLFALLAYLGGIVTAVLAARRLRRWLQPGTTKAIFSAALFPPQGLRWRRLLTDAAAPAPHPLLVALAAPGRRLREETAFAALADARWPLPLPEEVSAGENPELSAPPELLAAARAIRAWHADDGEHRFGEWLGTGGIDPAALLAPPRTDGANARSYCPRCRSQFVRAGGSCPRGIPLVPLPPSR